MSAMIYTMFIHKHTLVLLTKVLQHTDHEMVM